MCCARPHCILSQGLEAASGRAIAVHLEMSASQTAQPPERPVKFASAGRQGRSWLKTAAVLCLQARRGTCAQEKESL